MLLLVLAPLAFLHAVAAATASRSKCSKPVIIPQSVKGVGAYATCPPPFGKAKKLVAIGATRESINCVYNPSSAGVSCGYSSKTGKKSKNSSSKGCPAKTAKATGCGSLCYSACPAKLTGVPFDHMSIFYEDGDSGLMYCEYADGRFCQYSVKSGGLAWLEESDPACPAKSAAKPGYCLLP